MNKVDIINFGACTSLGATWSATRKALYNGEVGTTVETVHGRDTQLGRASLKEENDSKPRFHRLAENALDDLREKTDPDIGPPLGVVASTSKGGLGVPRPDAITGDLNPAIWASGIAGTFEDVRQVASPNTACATGLTAFIQASRWITDGRVDHAVVIASESCFYPLLLAGYKNLKVLCDKHGMRPFHPDRSGFALSEGAGAIYLSSSEFSRRHGLKPRATVAGWGETCDAHHMTQMQTNGEPVRRAIDRSLGQSGINREDVDLLHAHLTTTPTNDKTERSIIADWPSPVTLQGIKPSLGHTIGAAGLLEVMATVETLNRGRAFPLPTTRQQDIPDVDRQGGLESNQWGVSWNMGFGGHNAAVVIKNID